MRGNPIFSRVGVKGAKEEPEEKRLKVDLNEFELLAHSFGKAAICRALGKRTFDDIGLDFIKQPPNAASGAIFDRC